MNVRIPSLPLVLGAALVLAAPAGAQLTNIPGPVQTFGAPATDITGWWGTGLNDESGKNNGFGAFVNRSGEQLSFGGGAGVVSANGETEFGAAANVGFALVQGASATVGLQGGIGWFSPGDLTFLTFPLGVSVSGSVDSGEATIEPWVMPRLNIARLSSSGVSTTSTDFAASGGLNFSFGGAFGAGVAIDAVFADGATPILFGINGSYALPG